MNTIGKTEPTASKTPFLYRGANLRRAVTIFLLGTLTLLVILKLSGFKASWEKFLTLDSRYIVAAFAIYYFTFALRTLRWKILLRALGRDLSFRRLFSYLLVGWFISAVVPARAGDVARAYLLRNDRNVPLRRGLGSIFVERGLDGVVILSFSLIFSFFIHSLGLPKWLLTLYQATFSVLLLALLFLFFVPKLESKVRAFFSAARYQKYVMFLFRLLDKVRLIARSPLRMFTALLLTVTIWFCDALVTYFILMGLDYQLPLPWVAFISFTVNLAATVPLTPGAVGQIDVVQFSLFSLIGVARSISGVTILISRFICFWSMLVISGLVTYASGLSRLVRNMSGRRGLLGTPLETSSKSKPLAPQVSDYRGS
ncbi:lysylphosphatidylglycerol synthase transmembrane domain-containing protein [Candidatus Zixiibacteriota bacterium]